MLWGRAQLFLTNPRTCSSEKAHNPEKAHVIVYMLHIFKTSNKSSDSLWIEMRSLVKAFAAGKLKYRHIQF